MLDQLLPLVRPLAEVAAGTPILSEAHIVERVPAVTANRFRPRPDYLSHQVMHLDLAKHRLEIDGVAVGAMIGELRDTRQDGEPLLPGL